VPLYEYVCFVVLCCVVLCCVVLCCVVLCCVVLCCVVLCCVVCVCVLQGWQRCMKCEVDSMLFVLSPPDVGDM